MSTIVEGIQDSISGFSSGDAALSDRNMWAKPFTGYTRQEYTNFINGYNTHTYGIEIGFDGEYSPDQRMGISFFYTNANIDTNNVSQESDLDVYNLIAYGSNQIIDDKTNLFY